MAKTIITAALTGAVTPAGYKIPETPQQIANEAYDAWKLGAAVVHLHMRADDGLGAMDKEKFRETIKLIRSHKDCDVIINCTSSGASPEHPATDDERIADACKTYDMRYIMTSPDHDTPTGRIWEVSTVEDADLYLQLMGDEPLVNPAAFDLILPDTLPDDPYYVAVLTNIMEHPADVIDFSNQKVVTNAAREILLISRSPIPYPKGTLDFEYEKVTGIQLYSKQALKFYHDTPKSILEKAEENDMMRFIENGHKVHAIVSPYKTVSVDTPKDLALVSEILKGKE